MQPPFATNYTILYEREDSKVPEEGNFYAFFYNIDPLAIVKMFEEHGWATRKAGWTEWELTNVWSELNVEPSSSGVLLNGAVVFHPDNIAILDRLLDALAKAYQYEFYDAQKNLLLERSRP